ncbi:MAG TPA: protein kinase [Anaerolineales bacterium]|nr:protein kinase [Anaerolineales bacterium]
MRHLIGATIEHYQVLVKIRETPTRILYRVFDTRSKNYAAMEVVKNPGKAPQELMQQIGEQVHKNSILTHPNIAAVTDTGMSDGVIYIVYDFSPSYPFRRVFNRTYNWQEMSRELVSIANALAYAHENGVIHGSLHPSSVVLDERKNPILFDFGLEKIITNYILANSPGAWVNRWGFEYRSPEQLNDAEPDEKSDIYAMGMMLHEWLIGKITLLDSTILGTLRMRLNNPGTIDPKAHVPSFVQNLIQKCIAQDPANRYQSMQEVYIVLARGALDMTITQRMVQKPLEIRTRQINFKRLMPSLRIATLMILLAIALINVPKLLPANTPAITATPSLVRPTAKPTQTVTRPTSTQGPEAVNTETPQLEEISYPIYQGTPIPVALQEPIISPVNASMMIMLSTWGIGDVTRLATAPNGGKVAVAASIGIFIFDAQTLEMERYIDTRSWITAIDFSPDSQLLASGDRDGLIQIWNTETWEEAASPLSGHTKTIVDLAFSSDGAKLASISEDNLLIQWNVNATGGQEFISAEVVGGLSAVEFSSASNHLITGGNDFQISIWDTNNLTLLQTIAFSSRIVDMASAEETDLLIIGGNDQKVAILDAANPTGLTSVGSLQYPLTGVAVSPDGKVIAASDTHGEITAWQKNTKERFDVLWKNNEYTTEEEPDLEAPGSLHSLAFSADGSVLFSGMHNGTIRSMQTDSGAEVQQNRLFNGHTKNLVISHNSEFLITQQDGKLLTVWDLWNATPLYQLSGEVVPGDPFSQDDSKFIIASSSKEINVYDVASGNSLHSLRNYDYLKAIQFIQNDTQIITLYDRAAHLWSTSSGQELKITRQFEGTGCSTIYDLNGAFVAVVTNFNHVVKVEENRRELCVFDPLNWRVDINEARGMIVFGGSSKLTLISNMRELQSTIQEMHGVNRKNIVNVALNPNGDLIAAAYDDNTIHLWDIATSEEIASLYGHSDLITALRFTPDGKLLISTSNDGTIRLWGLPN